ncbi:MFS transporter [Deinococcus apachensis]|uniref:MFS transporter n=1 Tax=Deinococcus apachensis TaxID=309886 RepID=UPI00036984B6|nr:MFS transporter [Deinococcus apachensis]
MRTSPARLEERRFGRDAMTWAAYLLLGYFGFLINVLGPLVPFLREKLHLTYAQASLHTSAFAVGLLVASVTADRLAARFGDRRLLWGGAAGMAVGAGLLAVAPTFALSVLGTLIMGTLGSLTLVQVSAVLARRHGEGRGRAFAEANAISSLCGVLAPLAVGGAVAAGLGWPAVLWFAAAALVALALRFGRVTFPGRSGGGERSRISLPARYWRYWALLLLVVAVEFGVGFWGADFLRVVGGFTRAAAATSAGAFLLAMLIGRVAGGALVSVWPAPRVVALSLLTALLGFLLYWLPDFTVTRVLGLFVTGLGIANLYPALLTLAVGTAPGQEDVASARAALASGLAILLAPFALGAVADASSLFLAQIVIPALLVLAGAGLWWVERRERVGAPPNP